MAERMDETDDGFLGAQTTQASDTRPLQDVSSTPPSSDQMEVNAVDGNQVQVPASVPVVLALPKMMTPVSCLNEICVVRKLSIPQYKSMDEVGVANMKIFTVEVYVLDMELRETGHGRTTMEAKHEAATRILEKLRRAGERNEALNHVTPEVVKCHEMMDETEHGFLGAQTTKTLDTSPSQGSNQIEGNVPAGSQCTTQMEKCPSKPLLKTYKEIASMAEKLHLPTTVLNRAKDLFTRVKDVDGRFLHGRGNNIIGSACLYVACWMQGEEGAPYTLKEIWIAGKHSSQKEMCTCVELITEKLNTPLKKMTPTEFMPRFCLRLGLSKDVQVEAIHVAQKALQLKIVSTGHTAIALAAASVFMASQVSDKKKTRKEVAEVAGVCDLTVKTLYKKMHPHAFELFPDYCGELPLLECLPNPM